MKKANFTFFQNSKSSLKTIILGFLSILCIGINLNAQGCSMPCDSHVNISLDSDNCMTEITAAMILTDMTAPACPGPYTVEVERLDGTLIPTSPVVTAAEEGMTLKVRVIDNGTQLPCWGTITVEDKTKPVIDCPMPTMIITCNELTNFAPVATDNCGSATAVIVSDTPVENDCSMQFIADLAAAGYMGTLSDGVTPFDPATATVDDVSHILRFIQRSYKAVDDATIPNESDDICSITFFIERIDFDDIVCPTSLLANNGTNLECDGSFPLITSGPNAGHPAPRGTFTELTTISDSHNPTFDNVSAAETATFDNYMVEFVASSGTCQTVTISSDIGGAISVRDDQGNVIASGNTSINVTLCDGQRYQVRKRRTIVSFDTDYAAPIANYSGETEDYTLTFASAGQVGNFFPDVPYLMTGDIASGDVGSIDLYPDPDLNCMLLTTFADTDLGYIDGVRKIIREWTIIEWSCSTEQRKSSCTQMIEIADTDGPTFTCPSDYTVSTNTSTGTAPHNLTCGANVTPPVPGDIMDNCYPNSSLTVTYGFDDNGNGVLDAGEEDGVELPYDGTQALSLLLGDNIVRYVAYDVHGNATEELCEFTITVQDNTAPVAVCDQFTTVGLTSGGISDVPAMTFDDGSYDDCGPVTFQVRRMDNGANCGIVQGFGDYVTFCCNDIPPANPNPTVQVVFRVTDASGTTNECMVNVTVQDKLGPAISCPADLTFDCDFPYDQADLTSNTNLHSPFGIATATDNCEDLIPTVSLTGNTVNQCNEGVITRRFRAQDAGGNVVVCTQRITFEPKDRFFINAANPNDPNDDVIWPAEFDMFAQCANPVPGTAEYEALFAPSITGTPEFLEGSCDLVGANYEDQVFPFNNQSPFANGACFKIIRTWTVLDWCQLNDPTSDGPWEYIQVIKVTDNVAPVITATSGNKELCTFDPACAGGFIELTASANDAPCTDILSYYLELDAFSTGSFDDTALFGSLGISSNGMANMVDASGNYPIGTHRIRWVFADRCGNTVSDIDTFTILNCKAPTPICWDGLSFDLGDDGEVEIWASDFDNKSDHPCDNYGVVASFSATDTMTKNMVFDCCNSSITTLNDVNIYFYAITPNGDLLRDDNGDLVQDFCTASVRVTDNFNVCPTIPCGPTGGNLIVSGRVATEEGEDVEDVQVDLDGSNLGSILTNDAGSFAFPSMIGGGNYTIDPSKNDDPLNGVTTLDLVLIQKHILGMSTLDSPYKMIAADINKDASISAIDLLELRKLILGINADFQTNKSWRFVDADYQFADTNSALTENFPEVYGINNLNTDMNVGFTGVKIGDINNSVTANITSGSIENKSANAVVLNLQNVTYETGDIVRVPMTLGQGASLYGYQFTIEFDTESLEYVENELGVLLTNDSNFNVTASNKGIVTTSWNTVSPESIRNEEALFTLVFIAKEDGILAENFEINSEMTNAEAYTSTDAVSDIKVTFSGEELSNDDLGYVLYQNTPNPFDNTTVIAFNLPQTAQASLRIYDVTGKTIKVYNGKYNAGLNKVEIGKDMLQSTGILYYTLDTEDFTATKRMVVIK